MSYINPFVANGAGYPVDEELFVGRREKINLIKDDLVAQAQVSLVGLGRIGKTSFGRLVLKLISEEHRDITTARIQMNEFRKETELWKEILIALFPDEDIALPDQTYEAYRIFRREMRKKKQSGFKGVLLIDEFDSIREYEGDQREIIDRLREIACDRQKYGLTFLFVSRRSLARIQSECAGSNLYGVCQKYYLGPFNKLETREFIDRSNLKLDDSFLNTLYEYTGGYPYLLGLFMKEFYYQYMKAHSPTTSSSPDVKEIFLNTFSIVHHDFIDLFNDIRQFLSFDDNKGWEGLCLEFITPKIHECDMTTMEMLTQYGLINSNTECSCLSEPFLCFLQAQQRHLSMWDPLINLEQSLRTLVKRGMEACYGTNWIEDAPLKDDYYRRLFSKLNELASREQNIFKVGGSSDLLEYSYPGTLKDIILKEWDKFFASFFKNNNKTSFAEAMDVICKVRNPLAHGRRANLIPLNVLSEAEKAIKFINTFFEHPRD